MVASFVVLFKLRMRFLLAMKYTRANIVYIACFLYVCSVWRICTIFSVYKLFMKDRCFLFFLFSFLFFTFPVVAQDDDAFAECRSLVSVVVSGGVGGRLHSPIVRP